jgi:hypothetical protein
MGINRPSERCLISEELEEPLSPPCCHHWIIQSAIGPTSEGRYQKCGEVQEFINYIDYEAEWTSRKEVGGASSDGCDDSFE